MYTLNPPRRHGKFIRVLIFICDNLFLLIITCENLFFCENLFLSMVISDDLFEPFSFARIAFYLCPSVKMSSYLCSFLKCVHFIKHVFVVMVWECIFLGSNFEVHPLEDSFQMFF